MTTKTTDTIEIKTTQEAETSATQSFLESSIFSFLPVMLIFAVFYFLLIRPQENKRKELEKLIDNLKVGDQVLLVSGILGRVNALLPNNIFEVEIDKDVNIKVVRSGISSIIENQEIALNKKQKNKK